MMNIFEINKQENLELKSRLRCQNCGRFISQQSIKDEKANFHYIPDSQFGPEESYWECEKCS